MATIELGGRMGRSRHRRSQSTAASAGLPSWAQRHLDEAGHDEPEAPTAVVGRRSAAARGGAGQTTRGWGVAIVSVAAAVTAVPLAISSVAADRSDEPLPKINTFTAGAPGPLPGSGGVESGIRDSRPTVIEGDRTGSGLLQVPDGGSAPGAVAVAPAPVLVPAPRPAAVVRPTTAVAPPARSATRPTTPTTTTGTTTSTKPSETPKSGSTPSKPKPTTSTSKAAPEKKSTPKQQDGLLPAVGRTVNSVGEAAGGVVGGLL
ncbi:hypothetical protein [Actinomycetospora termitidis]|uniref:Uncharacterized protein n=1 Tax=Actinomycetospora termitidis TaxID=3053470 RepID=A0ABT7MBZ3_9PSEU|nr:hypothetical protein [Actinomycetospora sp. Odt1-22]MDL5158190.1 hypothetical protein [Actinomycetospora sp. Odt1-22]